MRPRPLLLGFFSFLLLRIQFFQARYLLVRSCVLSPAVSQTLSFVVLLPFLAVLPLFLPMPFWREFRRRENLLRIYSVSVSLTRYNSPLSFLPDVLQLLISLPELFPVLLHTS